MGTVLPAIIGEMVRMRLCSLFGQAMTLLKQVIVHNPRRHDDWVSRCNGWLDMVLYLNAATELLQLYKVAM